MNIMDLIGRLGGAFGGGQQGGPRQLGMFAQQQPAQQGGFLQGFEQHMSNPLVAAGLGAGAAMLNTNAQGGSFREALGAGLGGGAASGYGALRAQQQTRQQEIDRETLMQILRGRQGGIANQAARRPEFQGMARPGYLGGQGYGMGSLI